MHKHRAWILVTTLILAAITIVACATPTPQVIERVVQETVEVEKQVTVVVEVTREAPRVDRIVVGTNAEYPPFESVDDTGAMVGFDIDLMNAIAAAAGFQVEFVNTRWDGIFVALASGEFDAVISAATITEERQQTVDFSAPYYNAGQSLAVQAGSGINSTDDLAGKKVGVQLGTTGDIWASENTSAEVVRYDEVTLAFQALANGDVDAVINDAPTSADIIKANPEWGLTLVGQPFTEEFYGVAVRKDRPEVLAAINAGLATVRATGEYDILLNKWFGVTGIAEEHTGEVLAAVSAPDCDYGGIIKEIAAVDELTVRFTLCVPDPAFPPKAAFSAFAIQSREWIEITGGSGQLLERPVGTGPYRLDSWNRGDSIVFKRFDDYWGEPAKTETLVFRWLTEGAGRLLELRSGTVDGIDNPSPDDFDAIRNDPSLNLIERPALNVFYLAMTNTFTPWDDLRVRKAVALGIDRQRIVDNFYPAGSEAASHFTPCSIPNGCAGEAWYEFDVEAARELLAEAGYPNGFSTKIFYRDVFRGYLPEPGLVAQDIQAQLRANLNIDAQIEVMESGAFIAESTAGRLDGLYLLGWGADYPHVTNFLDFHFSRANPQFGNPHPEIYELLAQGAQIADPAAAAPIYEQANNAIKELIPMVPIAHGGSGVAYRADVVGGHASPLGNEYFAAVDPGGRDTFVWMQNAEPISLYCGDETDGESLRACEQVTESLFAYEVGGTAVRPSLAESCTPSADLTVWTCKLRSGVKFHDGTTLDSMDVLVSWQVMWDAQHPYHVGNTGAYEYFSYLWGLVNAE